MKRLFEGKIYFFSFQDFSLSSSLAGGGSLDEVAYQGLRSLSEGASAMPFSVSVDRSFFLDFIALIIDD